MATRKPVPVLDDSARPQVDGGPLSGGASSLELDVTQFERHPSNVRFEVALDEEMLESIRTRGILQPLLVAPTPGAPTYTVIDGNRRHLHAEHLATQEGRTVKVPVHVRHDLTTAQQQREAMLITGLQRLDLTAAEESKAYEDAILEGLDVDAIAKATGRRLSTIKSRLKLSKLGENAKTALHTGQLTIGDAESMASFADDPDATARLEGDLGTPNFAHALRMEEQRRQVVKETAASVKVAKKSGLAQAETPRGWDWQAGPYPVTFFAPDQQDLDRHREAGCLAFSVRDHRYYDVCTDPTSHQEQTGETPEQAEQRAREKSEWEQKQAERDQQREQAVAAMQLRLEDLQALLASTVTVKSLGPVVVAALRIAIPNRLNGDLPEDGFRHLMDSGDDTGRWGWDRRWLAEHWTAASDEFVVRTFIALTVADLDLVLAYSADEDDVAGVRRRVAAWDWFATALGVELSDIDSALRDAAELDAENVEDVPEAS